MKKVPVVTFNNCPAYVDDNEMIAGKINDLVITKHKIYKITEEYHEASVLDPKK